MEISATERQPGEQSARVSYYFMIQNGKLRIIESGHSLEMPPDPIAQALRLARPQYDKTAVYEMKPPFSFEK